MRKINFVGGEGYYWCFVCKAYVLPTEFDGTGFREYLCPGCGETLEKDPFGDFERERTQYDN